MGLGHTVDARDLLITKLLRTTGREVSTSYSTTFRPPSPTLPTSGRAKPAPRHNRPDLNLLLGVFGCGQPLEQLFMFFIVRILKLRRRLAVVGCFN